MPQLTARPARRSSNPLDLLPLRPHPDSLHLYDPFPFLYPHFVLPYTRAVDPAPQHLHGLCGHVELLIQTLGFAWGHGLELVEEVDEERCGEVAVWWDLGRGGS